MTFSDKDVRSIALIVREQYLEPPTNQCYEVCCDLADMLADMNNMGRKEVRVVPIYIRNTSVKHYIVELSESCVDRNQPLIVDPTIDQFSRSEYEKGNVSLSLGSEFPPVGIYTTENHPY